MGGVIGRLGRRRVMLIIPALCLVAGLAAGGWARRAAAGQLREAEAAVAARDSARARDLLGPYLVAHPDDARARLLAARTARRLREYYAAREHLRLYQEAGGDAETAGVEEELIAVQRGDDRPVDGLRRRAEQGDELALAVLEVLIQHDLDGSQLWLALDGLTRYLTHRPDDLQARLGRAFVWERVLYYKDALEDYRAAVAAHPDSDPARLKLADTLLVVGTPGEALAEYRRVAGRWPNRPDVRLGLARCHRQLGEPDPARTILDALLAENPAHGEALWERGELALDEGQAAAAEPWLRAAVRQLPNDRRVHFALYRCLLALGRRPEAEQVNARVARIDADLRRLDQLRREVMDRPQDAQLRYEGAVLFQRNGEREAAGRWLRAALRLDPGHAAAREALEQLTAAAQP